MYGQRYQKLYFLTSLRTTSLFHITLFMNGFLPLYGSAMMELFYLVLWGKLVLCPLHRCPRKSAQQTEINHVIFIPCPKIYIIFIYSTCGNCKILLVINY